jgi:hypothetical protein
LRLYGLPAADQARLTPGYRYLDIFLTVPFIGYQLQLLCTTQLELVELLMLAQPFPGRVDRMDANGEAGWTPQRMSQISMRSPSLAESNTGTRR